jgi:GT2 family glycosyltransferase
MTTPKVSIIIVNYNHKYFPRMCVEAIEKSVIDVPFEIIVVDNNSKDESIHMLRAMEKEGRIHLIESPENIGYGKGNNLGVKQAKGEYVVISNPDVFVNPDTMKTLLTHLEKNSDIGIIGPRLRYYNGDTQPSCRRHMTFFDLVIKRTFLKKLPPFQKRLKHYLMEDFNHNDIQDVDLITGAYFMMRKEVYEEVSGFDPRYFLFMEDYDLCLTLHKRGYRVVYFPKSEALHYHKRLSGGNIMWLLGRKVFWFHLMSAIKYFWKWKNYSPSNSKKT